MDKSIPNFDFVNQLENLIRDFLKEKLEFIMKEEIQNFLKVKQTHIHSSKNSFYQRSLDTRYGKIENLSVPRDRNGNFQTQLFQPYQLRDG